MLFAKGLLFCAKTFCMIFGPSMEGVRLPKDTFTNVKNILIDYKIT